MSIVGHDSGYVVPHVEANPHGNVQEITHDAQQLECTAKDSVHTPFSIPVSLDDFFNGEGWPARHYRY